MTHHKCGWCKRALKEKRREISPLGPECEGNIAEQINIALLNKTEHDSLHSSTDTPHCIAQRAFENVFGDEIDLIIVVDFVYGMDFREAIIGAFWNNDGTPELVNYINPDYDWSMDENGENYYNEEQLKLKRRLAMMLDNRTKTKVNVNHIDADWVWFFNGGGYAGPIPSTSDPKEWCEENNWKWPIGACPFCNLLNSERESIWYAEGALEEVKNSKEKFTSCGLGVALHSQAVSNSENQLEIAEAQLLRIEEDVTAHPWWRERDTGFLGNLMNWSVPHQYGFKEFVDNNEVEAYFMENGGHEIELESELGQKILANNVVPFFLRTLTDGFDKNWNWVHGEAKYDTEDSFWRELCPDGHY